MRALKYIVSFILICLLSGCSDNRMTVKIYYADSQLMKLVPVTYTVGCTSEDVAARIIADKLIKGMDNNKYVMRLIPRENGCMRVKLMEGIAYVDFSESSWRALPTDRDREKLAIYQVVNSFASLDGIRGVRLSVEGRLRKKADGHIETRDILLPESDM